MAADAATLSQSKNKTKSLVVNKMRQTQEEEEGDEETKPGTSSKRNLRKRKVNLNRLASSIVCPLVCQFQHCGVQLADGDTLEVSLTVKMICNKSFNSLLF